MANPPLVAAKVNSLGSHSNGSVEDLRSAKTHVVPGTVDRQQSRFNLRKYRPLGVADMFDEAFDLYKNNFLLLLVSTAIVYIPLYVVLYVCFNPLTKQMEQLATTGFQNFDTFIDLMSKTMWDTITASLVYSFATILSFGAVGYISSQRYLGRKVKILEAYALAGRRLLVLCFGVILAAMFSSLWGVFCGIGALIPVCRFAVFPQVAILEKLGIYKSVVRCWKMTSTGFWRIGMLFTMLSVVDLVMKVAFLYPIQAILDYIAQQAFPMAAGLAESFTTNGSNVVECAVGLFIAPFGIAAMTIAYYDIRIRDEGFDMAILNEALGNGTADDKAWIPDYKTKTVKKQARIR